MRSSQFKDVDLRLASDEVQHVRIESVRIGRQHAMGVAG